MLIVAPNRIVYREITRDSIGQKTGSVQFMGTRNQLCSTSEPQTRTPNIAFLWIIAARLVQNHADFKILGMLPLT